MRRFIASAWFPFLICLVMTGASVAAFAILKPDGADINQSQILQAMKIAGWVTGPAMGLLSLFLMGALNLLRRLFKMRQITLLHPLIVFLGILPWLVFGWQLAGEPPFTPIARGIVAFVARPMLWGSLVALIVTIVMSLPLMFSSKRS